jgi:hypothetical protein
MDFENCIIPDNLDYYSAAKPLQSVYLEFVRKNIGEILDYGEFEALRRWLLKIPVVMPVPVTPQESHRVAREFFKALRKEQKAR